MSCVIDGYNMLFALGWLDRQHSGPHALERARERLLGWLSAVGGADTGTVTVVFDASSALPDETPETIVQGIHVRYAHRGIQADDLIEEIIRRHSAPVQLIIVSDDHRLQQAARRRSCVVRGCADFVDWLERERRRRRRESAAKPDKPSASSTEETEHWLREFQDLADDPAWKTLSEPKEFLEEKE